VTPSEAVALTRYVKAACPQQKIDEFTPDVWHDLIGDLALADCRAAVATITGRRTPFVAPAEIRAEVVRIRNERIARSVLPAPPHELCDDPEAYRQALIAGTKLAAEGHAFPVPEVRAITGAARSGSTQPASLRAAVAGLRRQLGPGRAPRRALGDERQVARDQVAEVRARREAEGSEAS